MANICVQTGLNPARHILESPCQYVRCSVSQQLGALQTHTTDTFISHTTNVLLFKFRCNIFIGVRIIKEMPGSVASGTPCINTIHIMLIQNNDAKILRDYKWFKTKILNTFHIRFLQKSWCRSVNVFRKKGRDDLWRRNVNFYQREGRFSHFKTVNILNFTHTHSY